MNHLSRGARILLVRTCWDKEALAVAAAVGGTGEVVLSGRGNRPSDIDEKGTLNASRPAAAKLVWGAAA